MKKIFLNLTATAMLGLALTACNNEEANKKAAEADAAAVQTLVEDKMKAMDEEVTKACDEAVNAAAQHVVDSLAEVAKKGGVKKAVAVVKKATPKPVVTPKPAPKADPKKDKFEGDGKSKATPEQTKQKTDKFEGNGTGKVTPTQAQEDKKKKKFD